MTIIEKRHLKTLKILKDVADDVDPVGNACHASAIVYKNDIISLGTNLRKSHPIQAQYGKNEEAIFLHAELNAIMKANKLVDDSLFSKCTLYVVRTKADKSFGDSKPCEGCAGAISRFGFKNVIWSNDNSKLDDIDSFNFLEK